MLLQQADGYDFRMVYYNSDGNESSMCGNGGRCIVSFAKRLGIIDTTARFIATDGVHMAGIFADGIVKLQMQDVADIAIRDGYTMLNTGSPHYVKWVKELGHIDVFGEGRAIRNEARFSPGGINVNFVEIGEGKLIVRTYERGVEDETMSCGTGVTAAAIASACESTGLFTVNIETPGGALVVSFSKTTPLSAQDITLTGMATFVFEGEVYVG
jgi:diaminopimelate epimerase